MLIETLVYSNASTVEKLDFIASQFPQLAAALGDIADTFAIMEKDAEDTVDAQLKQDEAHKAEIEELNAAHADALAFAEDQTEQAERERDQALEDLATLRASVEAANAVDVYALLDENKSILDQLDTLKSDAWKTGRAEALQIATETAALARDIAKNAGAWSGQLSRAIAHYRGKFRSEIDATLRAMIGASNNALGLLRTAPALVKPETAIF